MEKLLVEPGDILAQKYEVTGHLGGGWEGEVYSVRERATGIDRAAKIFYPNRNLANRSANFYAKKLHKLRNCSIVIQYLYQDKIRRGGKDLTFLISEYVEGETLQDFQKRLPGKKMHPFQALHLLHALAKGVEEIHQLSEYHGDLHTKNIMLQRQGLGFDLKVVDMYNWGRPKAVNIYDDVCDLVRIFYDIMGGPKTYRQLPKSCKLICCGLKRTLILSKFKSAGKLRVFLENMNWES